MKNNVPRSPYDKTHGLVYFGRMLDKIRLHQAGKLADDYIPNLGKFCDHWCVLFLGVDYDALVGIVVAGATDEEAWKWSLTHGHEPTEEQIKVWNAFMTKGGWRDGFTETLQRRLREGGFEDRTDIQTMFDYMDLDEGRKD
ncbi:MAG: DUF5069 domain-containing protein [Chthoniobacterales bacterium]